MSKSVDNSDQEETEYCRHGRGKIVSYTPWVELCYECGKVIEGDPHGPRKAYSVPQAVYDAMSQRRN